jgi:hypothetical protein
MAPTKESNSSAMEESPTDPENYLERKYGKEPKISTKELMQIRWNWH